MRGPAQFQTVVGLKMFMQMRRIMVRRIPAFGLHFIDPALDHNMPPAAGTHTIRDLKMVELGRKKPEQ